jgi:hypothetical protein
MCMMSMTPRGITTPQLSTVVFVRSGKGGGGWLCSFLYGIVSNYGMSYAYGNLWSHIEGWNRAWPLSLIKSFESPIRVPKRRFSCQILPVFLYFLFLCFFLSMWPLCLVFMPYFVYMCMYLYYVVNCSSVHCSKEFMTLFSYNMAKTAPLKNCVSIRWPLQRSDDWKPTHICTGRP